MDRKIRSLPGPHLAWQIRPRRGAKTHLQSPRLSATLIGSPDKVDSTIARGLAIVPGGRQQSGRVNAAEYFLIEDISKGGRVVKLNVRDRESIQEAVSPLSKACRAKRHQERNAPQGILREAQRNSPPRMSPCRAPHAPQPARADRLERVVISRGRPCNLARKDCVVHRPSGFDDRPAGRKNKKGAAGSPQAPSYPRCAADQCPPQSIGTLEL